MGKYCTKTARISLRQFFGAREERTRDNRDAFQFVYLISVFQQPRPSSCLQQLSTRVHHER